MKNKITEILGWYGVVAILLAYGFSNMDILSVHSPIYQILNLTGALGIVVDALDDKDYQPAVLNVIWAGIAIIALFRVFF
ncbi:MAG: hypothetical protein WCW14_00035 [Candidatus Paceibacterota bacterium]|jgi:hypothetical protein